MESRATINKELKEMDISIPENADGRVHSVPAEYFINFSNQMLELIHCIKTEQTFPKQLPYSLPKDYFDALPQIIKNKLIAMPAREEIETLSPLLAGLKDKKTFEVPVENYFEESVPKRNIIPFPEPEVYNASHRIKWMRWVAAAAILCIFSIGGMTFLKGTDQADISNQSIQAALANIPDNVIQEYLNNNLDSHELYSNISITNNGSSVSSQEERLLNSIPDNQVEQALEYQMN